MTARPLTRGEWKAARPRYYTDYSRWDRKLADRIEATIENGGWASDPPTLTYLNEWAATKIMGWHLFGGRWTSTRGVDKFEVDDWQPSRDLGQALECVKEAGRTCQGVLNRDGRFTAYVDGVSVHKDASNTAELAEAILRRLHSEFAS